MLPKILIPRPRALPILAVLALSILSSEGLLRLIGIAVPSLALALDPFPEYDLPDTQLRTRGHPAIPDHDDAGFRNRDRPAAAVFVVLGDSHTYGHGVSRSQSWPAVLDERLEGRVYSFAFPGYGPADHLHLVDRALALGPQNVLLALYLGNDLYDAYRQVYVEGKFSTLRSTDFVASPATTDRRPPDSAAPARQRSATLSLRVRRLSKYSMLLSLARKTARGVRDRVRGTLVRYLAEVEAGGETYVVLERGPVLTIVLPENSLRTVDFARPEVEEGYRITMEVVRRIQARVEEAGGELTIVLIPTKMAVFEGMPSRRAEPLLATALTLERLARARLTADLEALELEVVDPTARLRTSLEEGRQPYPPSYDSHPNAAGHAAIAEAVLAALH